MIHIEHDPSDLTILINWQSKLIDDPHWLTIQNPNQIWSKWFDNSSWFKVNDDQCWLKIQVYSRSKLIDYQSQSNFIDNLVWILMMDIHNFNAVC